MQFLKNKKLVIMFIMESILLFLFILTVLFYHMTGFTLVKGNSTCLMKYLTGYYCPGCGGTRAFESLVHFHLFKSLYYHPVVMMGFLFLITSWMSFILYKITKGRISCYVLDWKHLIYLDAAFLIWFVIRNLLIYFWGIRLY